MIEVHRSGEETYEVKLIAGQTSEHTVLLEDEYYLELTNGDILPEELIQNAIRFLLEKEGVEEIEGEFDLTYVQRIFPDFEDKMKDLAGVQKV